MRRLLIALAAASSVAACSMWGDGVGDIAPATMAGELLRVQPGTAAAGMSAIVRGVVEVDLDIGCVWLSTPEGERSPVVWPAGTRDELEPFTIVLADGTRVHHGDQVSGGGGYVPASNSTDGVEPFPEVCLQTGEVAVFNADSSIEVTPDVGFEAEGTLLSRFQVPQPIGLELIAISPNGRSVAVSDFVQGTTHLYEHGDFIGPDDAVDGASGGGGFIHLWSQGTVYSYAGSMDAEPLVYRPDPLRVVEGVAPTLEVVPAPDGEHTWLVQDGDTTIVELVDLVEAQVSRLGSFEVEGSWQPAGATTEGLILVSHQGSLRTALVDTGGRVVSDVEGEALSVGWGGLAILGADSRLSVADAALSRLTDVPEPVPGAWLSVGAALIPSDAPPLVTGSERLLLGFRSGAGEGNDDSRVEATPTDVFVVGPDGSVEPLLSLTGDTRVIATWSRDGGWVAVVEPSGRTMLVPVGGEPVDLGDLVPEGHWALSAG